MTQSAAEVERQRRAAYREITQSRGFREALPEMLAYADREKDPAVRCGRLDMIAHLLRAAHWAWTPPTEETLPHAG